MEGIVTDRVSCRGRKREQMSESFYLSVDSLTEYSLRIKNLKSDWYCVHC